MAEWVEKGSIKGPPGEIPDVSDFLRDGDVSSAISGSSDKVASDKAVKDYVDNINTVLSGQISAEATSRQEQDAALTEQIGGKANVEHTHEMADVTGLDDKMSEIETSLSGKADTVHTHTTAQVEGLDAKLSQIDTNISGKADAVHTHTIENVTGLQDALDGKSATGHTHTSAEVTDLQGKLDAKADTVHTHAIADVTDLQTALDGKVDEGSITLASLGVTADATELNYMDGVTSGVQAQLDGKAASSHTHATSEVTGLDDKITEIESSVAAKADAVHTHVTSDVTGLDTALAGKANADHEHGAEDIVSGTLSVDRIPTIPDSKIGEVSAEKITGTIPSENLPSYVDDVVEVDNYAVLPSTGEAGKIYVDKETNKTYRWGGSAYVEISASLALGETSATAFRGDYGKVAYDHAQAKGSQFASGLYKISTNAEGHVTGATEVTKGDITALGVPAQDTTYVDATTSASGLMSSSDKTKLNGIADGANNYTHPTSDAGALGSNIYKITTDANGHIVAATPITKEDITALGIPSEDTNTTYTAGSGLALSGTEFGIADGGIIGRYLNDNCVMERNIVVGSVTSDKIPALAITTPKLVDNAITAIKMADNAVATRSIQDGAVTAEKIAEGVIPEAVEYDVATSEANGLMSSEDKTALDNLKTNAITTDAAGFVQKSPIKFRNYEGGIELDITGKTETSFDLDMRSSDGSSIVTITGDELFGEKTSAITMNGDATFTMNDKDVKGITDVVESSADGTKLATDKAVKDAIDAIEIPDPLPSGGTDGQVLTKTSDGEAWEDIPDYENATTEYDGLMSAADKTKLDGIQAGANNYTLPVATSAVLGGVKQGAGCTISEDGTLAVKALPDGGTTGQVLTKTADGEAWQDVPEADMTGVVKYASPVLLANDSSVNSIQIGDGGGSPSGFIRAVSGEATVGAMYGTQSIGMTVNSSSTTLNIGSKGVTSITDDASTGDTNALATAKAVKDYADSVGVPSGGTDGQILTKTNEGVAWASTESGKVFYVICPRYFAGNEGGYADLPVEVYYIDKNANDNIYNNAWLIGVMLSKYLYSQGADVPNENLVIDVGDNGTFTIPTMPAPTNNDYWVYDFYLCSKESDISSYANAEAVVSVTVAAPPLRTASDDDFKAYMGIS